MKLGSTITSAAAAFVLALVVAAACSPKVDADDAGTGGATEASASGTSTGATGEASTADTSGDPGSAGSSTTAATTGGTAITGDTDDATGDPTTGGGELLCPAGVEAAIVACVGELQADPELADGNFLLDLVLMCGDAEPVADDYDAHCARSPGDPICALDYPTFVEEVLPACVAAAQEVVFADVCLLPGAYHELLFAPGIALMERRFVTAADQLDPIEQEQLLWTSADGGFPAATVDEAILATDDDGFTQLTVLDVGSDRVLVLYTAHYGDTRVGRAFFAHTLTPVGAIEDGAFSRCGVERLVEGRPCGAPGDPICGDGFACQGVVDGEVPGEIVGPGACVRAGALAGEGAPCDAADVGACDPASGLLCLPLASQSPEGQCSPGWMRRSFTAADEGAALVAGGTAEVPIVVSGVATAPTAARLDLTVGQGQANALRVRLVNPSGTAITVVDTGGMPTVDVVLDLAEVAVPGDEPANGVWTLAVDDLGGAAIGGIYSVGLTLDTRWD